MSRNDEKKVRFLDPKNHVPGLFRASKAVNRHFQIEKSTGWGSFFLGISEIFFGIFLDSMDQNFFDLRQLLKKCRDFFFCEMTKKKCVFWTPKTMFPGFSGPLKP